MGETKVAIAERTIRSLKVDLYRYVEDHGYKYVHQLSLIVTSLKSRKKCIVDVIPKNVNISDICPFCTASHYENLENSNSRSEKEFASRCMTHLSSWVIGYKLRTTFLRWLQFLPKNIQYTQKKDEQHEILSCNIYKSELIQAN